VQAALRAAVAVELIHAYSLVHDDMPCMDNDVLRRGKPTVHVQFGEAQAMLAGDAMQALAFEVLTPDDADGPRPALQARLCSLLARAAGHAGMAGGQAIDLASVGKPLDRNQLRDMHRRKTGALLQAACRWARPAAAAGPAAWQALTDYGAALGLAFQVVDDILDVTQAPTPWARPPARTRTPTSPPTSPCWAWTPRARRHAEALRPGPCGAGAQRPGRRGHLLACWPTSVVERATADMPMHAPIPAENHRQPGRPAPAVARTELRALATELRDFVLHRSARPAATCRQQPGHGGADHRAALRVQHARDRWCGTWATRPTRTRS
jgi:farnesyl diphosphate synthase